MKLSQAAIQRTCTLRVKPNSSAFPVACDSIIRWPCSALSSVTETCAWKFAATSKSTPRFSIIHQSQTCGRYRLDRDGRKQSVRWHGDTNTRHETVSHTQKEWVTRHRSHKRLREGVWSLFKRSIVGSYHQISVKHLDRYLDEFEFRFNNRENSFLFRDTLLRLLNSTNLEYKILISDEDAA